MVPIHAFRPSEPRLRRKAASVTAFCLSLSACEGTDATWPRRPAELEVTVETPTTPFDDPLTDAGATVSIDAGETPQEHIDTEPMSSPTTMDAGTPVEAFDCSMLPKAPVSFETLTGFAGSEDFVFDERGNFVGVDADTNLVRVSKSGKKELWYPGLGVTAGMGILRDGSVVYCDVDEGALKRVYPNGSLVPLLGGLLYPNGLDIGPDGYVYVAENGGGRVRRVNPDTGEFTVIAVGLTGPNGVAFGNDPGVLYIGSFEGGGVYELELSDEPGQLAQARVFASVNGSSLREPIIACPDEEQGGECRSDYYSEARCQTLGNVVDCMPVDPCPELAEGDSCDYPAFGTCQSGRCIEAPNPCEGLDAGAACGDALTGEGFCEAYAGELYCGIPNPCEALGAGAACEDPFVGRGVCASGGGDELYCTFPDPCDGLSVGDACEDVSFGAGRCEGIAGEYVYCAPPNVCEGLREGSVCENPFVGVGVCDISGSSLYCRPPNACDGLRQGAPCEDAAHGPGFCEPVDGALMCWPDVCEGLVDGAYCEHPFVGLGVCQAGNCTGAGGGAGIDGIGVDVCGNVYVTEFVTGLVWRIAPSGDMEIAAHLPSGWIPNIKWGRDLGGFSSRVMYVTSLGEGTLFGLAVGAPGATEFYASGP